MKKADLKKRVASFALAGAVFATSVVSGNVFADTKDSSKIISEDLSTGTSLSTATDYGLVDNVQDGIILHCWNWSYSNISANMEAIAEAGYSAVQTSPIQAAKESTTGKSVGSNWWVYYQPAGFWIDDSGKSALGNKAEFKAMCDKAEQYGIKVIVDVVANHVGNKTSNNFADTVDPEIKDNMEMVHTVTDNSNYSTRYENTQKCICNCPDLNTGNSKIQNKVLSFLKECIDAGADGFRFDAAKHIETAEEIGNFASQFWPTVINGAKEYYKKKTSGNLYCYGEILDNLASSGEKPSVTAYTKYMSVTANGSSNSVMQAIGNSNASDAANSNISLADKPSKSVLWAESHDTWANDDGYLSRGYTVTKVQRAWAMIGSRADAAALYFARPTTETISGKTKLKDSSAATSVKLGAAKDTGWKDKQVAAVNHFHNYFVGAKEYLGSSDGVAFNMRYSETDGRYGVVLCHVSGGSKTLSDFEVKKVADGTYTDEITGNTFTVSGGKLSGKIGDTGIAVVYNAKTSPTPTISMAGGKFKTESVSVTFGLKNAASGTYKIGNSVAVTYTKDTTIEIGNELNVGESVTITLTATDGNTTSAEKTYTFTKADPAQVYTAYCKKPSGWTGELYCYAYDDSVENAKWPGEKMTKGSDGIYYYQIPDTIEEPNVIFYAGSDSMRYPASQEPGLVMTETKMIYDGSTWKKYSSGQDETTSQGQTTSQGETTTPVAAGNVLYVERPDGWNSLYAYVYDNTTSTTKVENAKWPGVEPELDSKTGYYKYVIPENLKAPKVIITDNAGSQIPGRNESGLALTGTMLLKDGKLSKYEIPVETTTGETTTGETTSETTTGETTSETTTGETTTSETTTQETTSPVWETTTSETTTIGVTSSPDETSTQETTSLLRETTTAETTTLGETSSLIETTTSENETTLKDETTKTEKETTTLKDETTKTEKETTTLNIETTTKDETKEEETTTSKKDKTLKITGFTASKKSGKVVIGQSIVLRVKAEKATSYKFTVTKKGGKETIIKPYSSKTKCSWRAAVSGTYNFKVYAKNSGKVVTKTITNFKIGRKLSINSITPSKKSKTAKIGNKINIKVKANGGIGAKYYKYYYILNGKKTDISKYVTKSSISWKPKKAGTYTLCVTVTDDAGNRFTKKISRYIVVK